jgi:hypothetical protein
MNDEVNIDTTREAVKDPHIRLSFALHEAAHILYGRRAGAIDVKYHGPMEYPGKPGVFGTAGIQLVFPGPPGAKVQLIEIARWHCAGSVVKRVLAPRYWVDDEDCTDYEICWEWVHKLTGMTFTDEQMQQLWKDAQQDVERDLRSPTFRQELWALARETEQKIPW